MIGSFPGNIESCFFPLLFFYVVAWFSSWFLQWWTKQQKKKVSGFKYSTVLVLGMVLLHQFSILVFWMIFFFVNVFLVGNIKNDRNIGAWNNYFTFETFFKGKSGHFFEVLYGFTTTPPETSSTSAIKRSLLYWWQTLWLTLKKKWLSWRNFW